MMADVEALAARYRAGSSCRKIALAAGMSTTGVWQALRDAGVELRPPGGAGGVGGILLDPAEVARRYRAGQTLKRIALELECSTTAVRNALVRAGVPRRPRSARPDVLGFEARVSRRAVRLYRDGHSLAEIARRLACSPGRVARALEITGVRPHVPARRTPIADRREIARRYRAGESGRAIAAALGISSRTVYGCLERQGVERRSNFKDA